MTDEANLKENNCNCNFTLKEIKFTGTNCFTESEYYRVLKYSADTENRMDTRCSSLYIVNCISCIRFVVCSVLAYYAQCSAFCLCFTIKNIITYLLKHFFNVTVFMNIHQSMVLTKCE